VAFGAITVVTTLLVYKCCTHFQAHALSTEEVSWLKASCQAPAQEVKAGGRRSLCSPLNAATSCMPAACAVLWLRYCAAVRWRCSIAGFALPSDAVTADYAGQPWHQLQHCHTVADCRVRSFVPSQPDGCIPHTSHMSHSRIMHVIGPILHVFL